MGEPSQVVVIVRAIRGGIHSFIVQKTDSQCQPRDIGSVVAYAHRIWIVDCDNHDRLVPLGAVGELVLEGPCLGRGYLNDPA